MRETRSAIVEVRVHASNTNDSWKFGQIREILAFLGARQHNGIYKIVYKWKLSHVYVKFSGNPLNNLTQKDDRF